MIAYLLIALFTLAAAASFVSLLDSAVQARNAFRTLRAELRELSQPAVVCEVARLRPATTQARNINRQPAPRLPRAVAA